MQRQTPLTFSLPFSPKKTKFIFYPPKLYTCFKEGYSKEIFLKDFFAGTTVGVIALPLALAFAIASGVTPERGLITAVIAGFLISLLGGSRFQIGGPTGAFVVVILGVIERHGLDGLVLATIIAGVGLIVLGFAGLGTWIKYIPYPVTTGFTAGIAVIIFSTQVKDFFGISLPDIPTAFYEKWIFYFEHLSSIDVTTTCLSVGCLILLVCLRKWIPKIPAPVIVVLLSSLIVYFFGISTETIGGRFGELPRSLPSFSLVSFSYEKFRAVFPSAMTIMLLAAIESLLCAVVADGMTGDRHHSNGELIAQGVANLASAFFGGIPATGALARTASNVRFGAKTPISGIIHALTVLLFILFLSPLTRYIPLSALAAILVLISWNMSEKDHFRFILKSPKSDRIVLLTTFLLTVFVDLTVGVEVGVVLAALLFMKRMSDVTSVGALDISEEGIGIEEDDPDMISKKTVPEETEVYEINGPFFFGVADRLKDVLDRLGRPPKCFILRMRHVPAVDATGVHALREFYEKCKRRKTLLILSGVNPNVYKTLSELGVVELVGKLNIHDHINKALVHAERMIEKSSFNP